MEGTPLSKQLTLLELTPPDSRPSPKGKKSGFDLGQRRQGSATLPPGRVTLVNRTISERLPVPPVSERRNASTGTFSGEAQQIDGDDGLPSNGSDDLDLHVDRRDWATESTHGPTPLAQSKICAAIDVSTSTRGSILFQEKLAIEAICKRLGGAAKEDARILPWSGSAHRVVGLEGLPGLKNSYGTYPAVLCIDKKFVAALKRASIWFLLTDGLIEEPEVRMFAAGLAKQRLHGKASIIITFGQARYGPEDLNLSVGIAVFAVSPNCLFLFHDIFTGRLYILQCKGSFNALLPRNTANPVLSPGMKWHELPQTSYERLSTIQVPEPVRLKAEEIALANGMVIDIRDIYSNLLPRESVSRIIQNDDNLKTVLMTASTRGHQSKIEAWLEKQTRTELDAHTVARPDLGDRAQQLIRELVSLMNRAASKSDQTMILQTQLRSAHSTNWASFLSTLSIRSSENSLFNGIVRDSRTRLDSMTPGRSVSLYSPVNLGTVSLRGKLKQRTSLARPVPRKRRAFPGDAADPWSDTPADESRGEEGQALVAVAGASLVSPGRHKHGAWPGSSDPPSSLPSIQQTLCYTAEYHCERPDGDTATGTCDLCGRGASPIALLLKKPDPELSTEGFPLPGARAKQAFPLAMGNFPETDVVSAFVCCDPCSFFVKKMGRAPGNEQILGAILITSWTRNFDLFTSAVDSALAHRFSQEDVLPIFLAILYTTLEDLKSADAASHREELPTALSDALTWLIAHLEEEPNLVSLTASKPTPSPYSQDRDSSFISQLQCGFDSASRLQGPVLDYPVEGFTVLVRAARRNRLGQALIKKVVFLRFLRYLAEQFDATGVAGDTLSSRRLVDLLSPEASLVASQESSEAPTRASGIEDVGSTQCTSDLGYVSISSLLGGPLLDEETALSFESLDGFFKNVESPEQAVVALFLQHLTDVDKNTSRNTGSFERVLERFDMQEALSGLAFW